MKILLHKLYGHQIKLNNFIRMVGEMLTAWLKHNDNTNLTII